MSAGCHNCPHDAEIARLREVCLACKRCSGDKVTLNGWTHVSLDAARNAACMAKMLSMTSADYMPRSPSPRSRVNVPDDVLPYLVAVIEPVTRLKDEHLLLLAAMLSGERLADIARRTGCRLQTVHARWKSLTKRNPAWLSLANGMIGSGRGRKPGKAKDEAKGSATPRNTSSGRGGDSGGGG